MNKVEVALELLIKVDNVYSKVIKGNRDVLNELDQLLLEILEYDDLSEFNDDEVELITLIINSFTFKVNLIYKILNVKRNQLLTMEQLREEFKVLEMKRFEAVNNYVMGIIRVEDIKSFEERLFSFRDKLYAIPISDSNLIEIAKMKSKVQHFNTEVLEDEEVLKIAYSNSN